MTADRYLRAGTTIPEIYWGELAHLNRAIRDAQQASRRVPGQHEVIAFFGTDRVVLRVYEYGELTWTFRPE
jgi:hypothetical protein